MAENPTTENEQKVDEGAQSESPVIKKKEYTLGLGKLLPALPSKKLSRLSSEEREELLFVQREQERETDLARKEAYSKFPLYKRSTCSKGERSHTIRELLAAASNFLQTQKTALPTISSTKALNPLSATSLDANELALLKHAKRFSVASVRKPAQSVEFGRIEPGRLAIDSIEKRENPRDSIQNMRSIFLAKLTMIDKKKEAERMNEYIERKEATLKLNKEIYQQDKKMVNDYLEYIKEQAAQQKQKADKMASIRHCKEAELDDLKRQSIILKKQIRESKEECRTLLEYKKFVYSLNPAVKDEIETRKKKKTSFFMTQTAEDAGKKQPEKQHEKQQENASPQEPGLPPEELRDLKEELDLSENDSDTELPVGFGSVQDLMEVMYSIENKNLALMQEVRNREDLFERTKKELSAKVAEAKSRLDKVSDNLLEMEAEEKKRLARLNDLTERDELEETPNGNPPQLLKKIGKEIESLQKQIYKLVKELHADCPKNVSGSAIADPPEAFVASRTLDMLREIMQELTELRATRLCLILRAEMTEKAGAASIVKNEEAAALKWREVLAEESRKVALAEEERRKEEALKRRNIPRVTKTHKELMQKRMLYVQAAEDDDQVPEAADDSFDDKYFAD